MKRKHHFSKLLLRDKVWLFRELGEKQINFSIWRENECDENISIQVDSFDLLKGRLFFKKKTFNSINDGLNGKKVFIKGSVEKAHFFSHSKILWSKNKQLHYIKTTSEFYKCDVRQNVRFSVGKEVISKVKIRQYYFDLHDLSVGGLKFINPYSGIDLKRGSTIDNLILMISDEAFEIPHSEIVRRMIVGDNRGNTSLMIGVKFIKLPEKTKRALFKAINSMIFLTEKKRRANKNK